MTQTLNKVTLLGNLGADPIIKDLDKNGRKIASLSIATSESWKDKVSGEKKEKTEWHRVVIFNPNYIELIEKYVKKGQKLYIEGSLHTRKWIDDKGQEKYSTEILLQGYNIRMILLSGKSDIKETPTSLLHKEEVKAKSILDDDEIPF